MSATLKWKLAPVVAGLLIGFGSASVAHPAGDFYSAKWPIAGTTIVDAYFTEDAGWGNQKKDSVTWGFGRSGLVAGADFEFNFPSGTHADYPGFNRANCTAPYPNNDIHWDGSIPNSSPAIAVANACDTDGDGRYDSFLAIFDEDVDWYVGSGTPGPEDVDLRATAAHEAGHVTGFGVGTAPDHFSEDSSECPSTSGRHTMCPTIILGKIWQRSLELHDEHTLANAY
jgi:hypothetical protein